MPSPADTVRALYTFANLLTYLFCRAGSAGGSADSAGRSTSFLGVVLSSADVQSHRQLLADSRDLKRADQQPLGGGALQELARPLVAAAAR